MNRETKIDIAYITYNQARYVESALKSVFCQKLPEGCIVRIIISDDGSTDNTLSEIRRMESLSPYPFLYVSSSENRGMVNSYNRVLSVVGESDYFCILEGDDYWIDTLKLKKQLDVFYSNPQCGLCYTDCDVLYEDNGQFRHSIFQNNREINSNNPLFESDYLSNTTWMIRSDVIPYINIPHGCKDIPLVILYEVCLNSHICKLECPTGVYRVHSGSVSAVDRCKKDRFLYLKSVFDIRLRYVDRFPNSKENKTAILLEWLNTMYEMAWELGEIEYISCFKMEFGSLDLLSLLNYIKNKDTKAVLLQKKVRSSVSYKLGHTILLPIKLLRRLL